MLVDCCLIEKFRFSVHFLENLFLLTCLDLNLIFHFRAKMVLKLLFINFFKIILLVILTWYN
jgi:hypothetical protein